MRITSGGNVNIGRTTSGSPGLSVNSSTNISFSEASDGQSIATMFRQSSSGALVLGSGVRNSATANGFASSYPSPWARSAISVGYGAITFNVAAEATVAIGTDTTVNERMRINSSGNVGIGVVPRTDWLAAAKVVQFPTNHSIVQNSTLLYTFSNLYLGTDGNFRYTGSAVGGYFYSGAGNFAFARSLFTPTADAIAVTSVMLSMSPSTGIVTIGALSAGSITETSSITYKENVNPIMQALDAIVQLTGVTYDRKDGSSANEAGLIAEEVNEVLPNIVTKNEEGKPEGIQYTKLTAYLIECIKELKSEIDMLKGK
jgi:hypothetical protein